jgi:hypothetical protein
MSSEERTEILNTLLTAAEVDDSGRVGDIVTGVISSWNSSNSGKERGLVLWAIKFRGWMSSCQLAKHGT